uniref:Inhibitor of growth family, member 3 n=1 Tax=Mus musculus TaxID=10090 RepID=S4R2I3_MOUSE
MLYLEDYLEMIEQLPMDLRDRFTEMREMDLQVQIWSAKYEMFYCVRCNGSTRTKSQ